MSYREKLIAMVKASGQELIDRAEDLVGQGTEITDFDIWLRFPQEPYEVPKIEVRREHIATRAVDVLYPEARVKVYNPDEFFDRNNGRD